MQCKCLLPAWGLSLNLVSPARPQIVIWVWEWMSMMNWKVQGCFYFGFLLEWQISCAKERKETRGQVDHCGPPRLKPVMEMVLKVMIITALLGKANVMKSWPATDTQLRCGLYKWRGRWFGVMNWSGNRGFSQWRWWYLPDLPHRFEAGFLWGHQWEKL